MKPSERGESFGTAAAAAGRFVEVETEKKKKFVNGVPGARIGPSTSLLLSDFTAKQLSSNLQTHLSA